MIVLRPFWRAARFLRCRRKWYIEEILGLEPIEEMVPLPLKRLLRSRPWKFWTARGACSGLNIFTG